MADHDAEYDRILQRAAFVFGSRPFTAVQIAIECQRRNDTITEALLALVGSGKLEKIDGWTVTYKVKEA